MTENQEQIERLQAQLDKLVRTQIDFQREVSYIHAELDRLRGQKPAPTPIAQTPAEQVGPSDESKSPPIQPTTAFPQAPRRPPPIVTNSSIFPERESVPSRSSLEKYVGENLLSKIGIVILILGVAIGAKYAIDQGWISPLVRIVFGYGIGFSLIGIAVWLKAKYETFSAVLLSGGMAVMYFITYFAYSLYQLIGQPTAFSLMVIFTVFTVSSAVIYSRQIIAHLGLVGAYAVPFLLSDNSGRYAFLFTYIAIINAGILGLSLVRYWKPLFYSSFILTWATFYFWWLDRYNDADHFGLAFTFVAVYFLIFYVTFIGYKLRSGENVALENVSLVLANSLIFYGFGYNMLAGHPGYEHSLGMFTAANAGVHLTFGIFASRIRGISTDFIYLLGALVLTFITITIPVEFHGHTVTVVWSAEAAVLFWIGRTKPRPLFEHFSLVLMVLASIILTYDIGSHLFESDRVLAAAASFPFFSAVFVTSIFYSAAFAFIFIQNRKEQYEPAIHDEMRLLIGLTSALAATFVFYNAFRSQISDYCDFLRYKTAVGLVIREFSVHADVFNNDYLSYSDIWQLNYTMLFFSLMAFINFRWFRRKSLAAINLIIDLLALVSFIFTGLIALSYLRESYLLQTDAEYFRHGILNLGVRYISYLFVAGLLVSIYRHIKQPFLEKYVMAHKWAAIFEMLLMTSMLFILSSELLNWMDILGQKDSYKLGLSIFWGVYSLVLVGIGIYYGRNYLRISAIVLFGITLAKIFFYDIENLSTLAKTAVFVSLGGLMLIVSFLYHKYKSVIFGNEPAKENRES